MCKYMLDAAARHGGLKGMGNGSLRNGRGLVPGERVDEGKM